MKQFLVATRLIVVVCALTIPAWSQQPDTVLVEDSLADEETEKEETEDLRPAVNDSLPVQQRAFNISAIEELRNDRDLDYQQAPTVGEDLWTRFKQWLAEFLSYLFGRAVYTNWGRIFIYGICLLMLIIIIMALLRVDAFKVLFSGADKGALAPSIFHENIHEMDFEKLIREAMDQNDFRNGIRLIFLFSLKLLADRQHIIWEPGKTNHDYLREIKLEKLKSGLVEMSYFFDYAWYGGFEVSSIQFGKVYEVFTTWRNKI